MTQFLQKFKNKNVLVTGHTGFKGSWLSAWLCDLGAHVFGYSKGFFQDPSHFGAIDLSKRLAGECMGDVCDENKLSSFISEVKPDFIFHLAAQALVSKSFQDPVRTFQTKCGWPIKFIVSHS